MKENALMGLAGLATGLLDSFAEAARMEAWEEKGEVHVSFEVPGFSKDQISVSFVDGILRVSCKKPPQEEVAGREYWTSRRPNNLERSCSLPEGLDASKSRAEYKSGILTVTLPKTEGTKSCSIKIE